jgi:opacity protein-like surface antigen
MKKIFLLTMLTILASLPAMAQDAPKAELFGGYSYAGGNFHGWNTSITGNINKWLGVMADFSGHYGSEIEGVIRVKKDAHSFLFGPRFSRRRKRLTPFAYALFGATHFHESATVSGQKFSDSDTGFSLALGSGLDVRVNDHIAIRAFQLDFFRPNFFGEAHNRGRLAFGVVFRFGKK